MVTGNKATQNFFCKFFRTCRAGYINVFHTYRRKTKKKCPPVRFVAVKSAMGRGQREVAFPPETPGSHWLGEGSRAPHRTHLVQRDAQELAERVQAGGARGAVGKAGRRRGCHPASSEGGCPSPGKRHTTLLPPARVLAGGRPRGKRPPLAGI